MGDKDRFIVAYNNLVEQIDSLAQRITNERSRLEMLMPRVPYSLRPFVHMNANFIDWFVRMNLFHPKLIQVLHPPPAKRI
jgi:hypothetical protein